MFCVCVCVGGNVRTAENLQPSSANFKQWKAVFIKVVTYYPGLLGGKEEKRRKYEYSSL